MNNDTVTHELVKFFTVWAMQHSSALNKQGIAFQLSKNDVIIDDLTLSTVVDELCEEGFLTKISRNIGNLFDESSVYYYPNKMYNDSPKLAKFGGKTGIFESKTKTNGYLEINLAEAREEIKQFFIDWSVNGNTFSYDDLVKHLNRNKDHKTTLTMNIILPILGELIEEYFIFKKDNRYFINPSAKLKSKKLNKFSARTGIFEHFKSYEHWTDDFNGKFWGKAGAGVLVICETTNKMLLGLRSYDVEEPGTLGIFGGKVDERETNFEKVALRELYEETRYNGKIKMIPAYVYKTTSGSIKFEYHNFIGLVDKEFEPVLDWENDDAFWMTYQEALNQPNLHFGLKKLLSVIEDYYPEIVTLS